ncbi:hypothetical protein AYJ57_13445 [Salipiger sp. CCB-MM3]|uniref:DUF3422 family protein n=1 Tax=Roseobacteraceae TaxID=2854170 RepID=UPI00080ABB6A|nr:MULTISPECIES: DUF3422 domain-containing protein [Roseobacteraceae]ANT61288.1 hypothetical protein AYJ57_13445 [Salipiger sp. CCB-MM3]MCA0994507.1 DUF3422 domain-containing protein [Alloyangia pacifica]
MPPIQDHPLRYQLANELHARPFPALEAPCRAIYLAIKRPSDAASRDRSADLAHLIDLLDRHGAPHPQPDAKHYSGKIGKAEIKWELHTEFVTYTAFLPGLGDTPFDPRDFGIFPEDWLEKAPGVRMTSAMIRIAPRPADPNQMNDVFSDWFVADSVAVSRMLDDALVVGGDFRIDPAGHQRFGIFVSPGVGERRVGRVVQRICEIEVYKTMAMLGFTRVTAIRSDLIRIDEDLTRLSTQMTHGDTPEEDTLRALLRVSSELETVAAQSAFRLSATAAYEALVGQRIAVLREERFEGRQTFREFMARRFDPAMRTVKSSEKQLSDMSARAMRAAELLRTSVEVKRSAQNQDILASMDKRADQQLQLQTTVEGLSVVAISYYAVSLVGYLLYPVADAVGISKGMLTAMSVLPVVLLVWLGIHRIRHKVEGH